MRKSTVLAAVIGLHFPGGCATPDQTVRTTTVSAGSVERVPAQSALVTVSSRDSALRARTIVRALYANRSAAQSVRKMRHLIAIADTTEINAIVLDINDQER